MSEQQTDKNAQFMATLAAMSGAANAAEPKEKDWLHGGHNVRREFDKNLSFAVGISGDLIRESFNVVLYLAVAGLVFIPLLYWPNARPIAGLLVLITLAFAVEIYWHRAYLRWALTYRLALIGLSLYCCAKPLIYSLGTGT